jgi:biotin operon repressor
MQHNTLSPLAHILRLHRFIQRKSTGAPHDFAHRLGLSRATLFRHLEGLRDFDAEIAYDKKRGTYFYKKQPDFTALKKILSNLDD